MFETWLTAKGIDAATLGEPAKAALQAAFAAEQKPVEQLSPKPAEQVQQEVAAAFAAAMKRNAAILKLCGTEHAEIAAKAAEENWSEDRVKAEVAESKLAKLRAERPSVQAGGRISQGPVVPEVLEAAVIQAAGMNADARRSLEAKYKPEVLQAAHDRYKGRLSLQQMLVDLAFEGGYNGSYQFRGNERSILQAAFSTNAVSGILSNTANKFLLAGYMGIEQAWSQISSRRAASDFKTMTSYRMTGAFLYEKVGPGGEIKHGETSEESFTNKVETYGKMFAVTRQDMINDDLGALTDLPMKIGRGAGLKLNDVFWTEFLDNSTFFTSGNSNYISGATTTLTLNASGGLEQGVTKFDKLTDPDGYPLGFDAELLLVPPELRAIADQIYVSTNVNTGGAATADRVANANPYAGKYRPVVSRYLSNTSYTGYSTTAWYLLANPANESTIEVAFLNGVESPTVETADADFSTLGIQMRGFHDFGVNKQSTRGGIKSKGAA